MTPTAAQWIDEIVRILAENGYSIGTSPLSVARLATKRVNSLGPFLPCTDYLFIHDCSADESQVSFEELHERARVFAEAQFRLPRMLRYHIPNTVSIGVSEAGFSADTIEFAKKSKLSSPLVGGEKHSTYLFDSGGGRLYSQGVETTPGRYGSSVVTTVNPTNRMHEFMTGIFERLKAE